MQDTNNTLIQYHHYKSILCLNGDLPPVSFFETCRLPIICADGAANTLTNLGIQPDYIIGDLDSISSKIKIQTNVLHDPDQNSNDFQKALGFLKNKQLLPSIIVGMNGGYLDHILNNINLFLNTDNLLYAPPIIGHVLRKDKNIALTLPENTKISLLGIPSASISTEGLKWELTKYSLAFPGKNSCFNRTMQSTITIKLHEGIALALIYEKNIQDAGSC